MRTQVVQLLFGLALALPASAAVTFTVGPSAECEFDDLTAAVAAADAHPDPERTIRVMAGLYEETSLSVQDSMSIFGGFESCAPDSPSSPVRSTLVAIEGRGVVVVHGADAGRPKLAVRLARLTLEGGEGEAAGGLVIALGADVELDDVLVLGNRGELGGGIFIDGSEEASLTLRDSAVNGNEAADGGGGLFCRAGGRVVVGDGSELFGNRGTLGGAVHAEGCTLDFKGPLTIASNRAAHGGGLYLVGGTQARVEGRHQAPVVLRANRATDGGSEGGTGGGTFVGAGSSLRAIDVVFERNQALHAAGFGGVGGGVMATERGFFRLDGSPAARCGDVPCARFDRNEAFTGAAFAAQLGGLIEVVAATVTDHHPVEAVVVAAGIAPPAARVTLEGVVLAGNTGNELVRAQGAADVVLRHLTATTNPQLLRAVAAGSNGATVGSLKVVNSIFDDPVPVFSLAAGAQRTASCLLVATASGLQDIPDVVVADPQLVDPANGDFHLTASSAAVDACLPDTVLFDSDDADGDQRGVAVRPGAGNRRYDAGADELGAGIFADGFESGDTGAWASVG